MTSLTTIGIVGHGAFGTLVETLIRRFRRDVDVRVYAPERMPDGERFFSFEETCASDVLILAVPIAAYESVLRELNAHTPPHTILVNIATIQMHTEALFKKFANGRNFICAHPMFGPESYAKRGGDVTHMRIVLTAHTLAPDEIGAVRAFLSGSGFDIVEMRADVHDKHLAETLFLTHLVGQTIHRGGFERTNADTVSFGFLMDAVESVRNDAALFADVFRFNPFAKEVLRRFKLAQCEVEARLMDAATSAKNTDIMVPNL